jgi:excinuclease ABC subunit C
MRAHDPEVKERLKEKVRTLPTSPGVYLFKDIMGRVLYVGKSVSLRHRVSSYLQDSAKHTGRIALMVIKAADVEVFETRNEDEALLLEFELINKHAPRYNIVFRDDKTYPYLKVTREEYPRIIFTRKPKEGDGTLLGPFTSADSLRKTLRFLATIFPVRSCRVHSSKLHTLKVCMDFHIKRCLGPCEGKIDAEGYQKIVGNAVQFLKGKDEELVEDLRGQMKTAADKWELEKAARIKSQLAALERLTVKQHVAGTTEEDFDIVAVAGEGSRRVVQQVQVRGGKIKGQNKVMLKKTEASNAEVMLEFVKQHYLGMEMLPREILTAEEMPEAELIARVLSAKSKRRVEISVPQRGRKRALAEMAAKNARLFLNVQGTQGEEGKEAIAELAQVLSLARPPERIECFDISHTGGTETVASMVVAQDGVMDRSSYRRFRIKTVEGNDDFASMREVIERRYARVLAESQPLPDLVLIDGGKGQLAAGKHALIGLGLGNLAVASLAKKEEILFAPHLPDGLALPEQSLARRLVQRIRDEAHRFAITYHRKLRGKRTHRSELDDVAGVGPRSRALLLRHFGAIDAVKAATVEQLVVAGVTKKVAERVRAHFASGAAPVAAPGERR